MAEALGTYQKLTMVNLSLFYHHFGGIYHRGLRLAAPKVRRVAQPIYRQFADQDWEFADSADFEFVESTDNLPIFARNLPILALAELRNPSIIHRRCDPIYRSACRNRSVASSSHRRNAAPVDRPNGPPNRKVTVNRFPVIVNPAALNPSRIFQSRAPIHQFASRDSTSVLARQSSDRHPIIQPSNPTPMNSQLSATDLARICNCRNL